MQTDPTIFRAYDIRGTVGKTLSEDAVYLIARAFGSELRTRYRIDNPKVVLSSDARIHSPLFAKACEEGLLSTGCMVLTIGMVPSPVNYFTIVRGDLDGGVQITASHNPPEDNGMKLSIRNAEAFSGDHIQDLYKRICQERFLEGEGESEDIDAVNPYVSHISSLFKQCGKGHHCVIDAGNGIAGPIAKKVLEYTGCSVEGLYLEPDGTFPNHPADPSNRDTLVDLQRVVIKEHADIGFAFDGDGDRLGIVDENGDIRTPDEILLLLAKDLLTRHRNAGVVFTVSNSSILETEIPRLGGRAIISKVGHSFVEHKMREENALLAGEQSGHFFCAENYHAFDDALVAALNVLRIVSHANRPLSELLKEFPKTVSAPERRPHCSDEKKAEIIKKVTKHFLSHYSVDTLDGARIDFGDGAWAGIRQSNTSPCISICIEARSKEKLTLVEDEVLEHLQSYPDLSLSL